MIKSINTDFAGQVGVKPRLVRIETDNTREEVLTNDFLKSAEQTMGFVFQPTDLAAVSYDTGQEVFEISITSNGIILVPNPGLNSLFSFQSFPATAADIILENPLATTNYINFVDIFLQAHMPLMNQSNSRQVGEKITFKNVSATESMTIVDFSGSILANQIVPGGYVVLTVTDTSTPQGSFDVELPLDAANNLSEVSQSGTHTTTWRGIWADDQAGNLTYNRTAKKVGLVLPSVLNPGDGSNSDIIQMNTLLPSFLRPVSPVIEPRLVKLAVGSDAFGTLFIDTSGIVSFSAGAGVTVPFSPTTDSTGFYNTQVQYEVA